MKSRIFWTILFAGLLFLISFDPIAFSQKSLITCPRLINPIILDGKITTSEEWKDALEIDLPQFILDQQGKTHFLGNSTIYGRLKHDETHIYVLVDALGYVQAKNQGSWDWHGIAVDYDHDQSNGPNTDDILYIVNWDEPHPRSWKYISLGPEAGWEKWSSRASPQPYPDVAWSTEAINDPYSSSPHLTMEFKIPADVTKQIGFQITTTDFRRRIDNSWPAFSNVNNPATWGTLEFSNKTILEIPQEEKTPPATTKTETAPTPPQPPEKAEYYSIAILIIIGIILAAVVAIRKRHHVSTHTK
jgi:hypothetical protein